MAQPVCLLDVRIFLEEDGGALLLSDSPFVSRFEQQIPRAYKQLLAGVAVWVSERFIIPAVQFGFLNFIVGLLNGIPAVFYTKLLYRVTSKLLDMESVDDTIGHWEAARTILRMESDKSRVTSSTA